MVASLGDRRRGRSSLWCWRSSPGWARARPGPRRPRAAGPDRDGAALAAISPVTGISCPSPHFCAAVDGAGNVLTSLNPTGGALAWSTNLAAPPSDPRGGGGYLNAISCPSASLCVGVGTAGDVVVSTDPAGATPDWRLRQVDSGEDLVGVSCVAPGAVLCVAIDNDGDVVSSTDPQAGAWQVAPIDPAPT